MKYAILIISALSASTISAQDTAPIPLSVEDRIELRDIQVEVFGYLQQIQKAQIDERDAKLRQISLQIQFDSGNKKIDETVSRLRAKYNAAGRGITPDLKNWCNIGEASCVN